MKMEPMYRPEDDEWGGELVSPEIQERRDREKREHDRRVELLREAQQSTARFQGEVLSHVSALFEKLPQRSTPRLLVSRAKAEEEQAVFRKAMKSLRADVAHLFEQHLEKHVAARVSAEESKTEALRLLKELQRHVDDVEKEANDLTNDLNTAEARPADHADCERRISEGATLAESQRETIARLREQLRKYRGGGQDHVPS